MPPAYVAWYPSRTRRWALYVLASVLSVKCLRRKCALRGFKLRENTHTHTHTHTYMNVHTHTHRYANRSQTARTFNLSVLSSPCVFILLTAQKLLMEWVDCGGGRSMCELRDGEGGETSMATFVGTIYSP